MLLSVGQLAKLTGLTIRALHHYDAIGLLVPSHRSDAGYRLYAQSEVIRLYRIQALQRVGLSLAEIDVALTSDVHSLEHLMSQQLEQLDEQIARSTMLRGQLQRLHGRLKDGQAPSVDEWLSTLEMIGTYDRHCSPEEIGKMLSHRNDSTDEWRVLIDEVRDAMTRKLSVDNETVRALSRRWMRLVMQRMGGDAGLAHKIKVLYYDNPTVQARTLAGSGFDKSMMDYLLEAIKTAHLALWTQHLPASDINRLRLAGEWSRGWMELAGAARDEMDLGASPGTEKSQSLENRWNALVRDFADDDARIAKEVSRALNTDTDLQELWGITPELVEWIRTRTQC